MYIPACDLCFRAIKQGEETPINGHDGLVQYQHIKKNTGSMNIICKSCLEDEDYARLNTLVKSIDEKESEFMNRERSNSLKKFRRKYKLMLDKLAITSVECFDKTLKLRNSEK